MTNTTKIYTNVFPRVAVPVPPRKYEPWLKARLENENSPIPANVTEENRVKIEPWMTRKPLNVKIFGSDPIPPASYVAPPAEVKQCPMIPIVFIVLDSYLNPIHGFEIRINDQNLLTNEKGEAYINVYQGHDISFTTGSSSGWTFPMGAKRKVRMTGMIGISDTFTVDNPRTIPIYPMAGEWTRGDGVTRQQLPLYTTP